MGVVFPCAGQSIFECHCLLKMIFSFTGVVIVESSESSFLPASGTILHLAATLLVVF